MLRVYFLQNWCALSDPMAEETLYDSDAMRRFAGIELGDDHPQLPPSSGALRLTEAIFADVNAHLADKDITLCSGTLVDVSRRTPSVRVSLRKIIDAPSSTKNKPGVLAPEMSSMKNGNTSYFGMKAHVGVGAESGVTHSLETSTAVGRQGLCQRRARPPSRKRARSGA
jgi:IS5 family transposase